MSQAFVQGAYGTVSGPATNASVAVTFSSNVAVGNLLVALCRLGGAAPAATCTAMGISDSRGNAWTPVWSSIQSPTGGTINKFLMGWYCASKDSGAMTITQTSTSASIARGNLMIAEFSGFNGNAYLGQSIALAGSASSSFIPLNFQTTIPKSIIVAYEESNALTGDPTVNSPFTLFNSGSGAATASMTCQYVIAPTTGSYSDTGTFATSGGNTNIAFGFSVSATQVPNSLMMMGCGT